MMKVMSLMLLPVSLAVPDWCRWVPLASQQYVPQCNGYVYPYNYGFACASWCQWVPAPSWGYTPACSNCYDFYSRQYKSAAPATALLAKSGQLGCKASCQWLSRPAWNSTSDCENCEQPLSTAVPASTPSLKLKRLRPDWCKWVPLASLQYVAECNGASGVASVSPSGACASWCGWSPVSSWQYIPECQACSPELPTTSVTPYLGCESWCQWVSRPAWIYTPNCAGCEPLAQKEAEAAKNEVLP